MLSTLFARRYLFSPQSRSVVNLISGLSVVAVAVPIAAMIILLSVFNGFAEMVRGMYSAFDADLSITPSTGQVFLRHEIDSAAVANVEGVEALSFALEQRVLLDHDGHQTTATLRGVDDGYEAVYGLSQAVDLGDPAVRIGDLERLVIGQSMAYELGIRALADADIALYAVRRGEFSSLLPMSNYTRRTVPVGGVFTLDLDTERNYLLGSLRLTEELLRYPDRASTLALKITDGADPQQVRQAVAKVVGAPFRVLTRDELRASFYRIMTYEKWGIFFIALLVMLIASCSVVGALAMLIVEKRNDMQTLRALGANRRLIRAIFRNEGLLICAWGALFGTLLGVGLTLGQQHFGWIEIPAETFLTKSYPVSFHLADLVAVLGAFTLIALILTRMTVQSMVRKNA